MNLLAQTANSLWQVIVVGLLFGAGLPAVFALGLKSLSNTEPGVDGVATPTLAGRVGAVCCFAVVLISVITGILLLTKGLLASSFGVHIF